MKQNIIKIFTLSAALLAGTSAYADPLLVGMYIDAASVEEIVSPQEKAAAQWFQTTYVDRGTGAFITNDAAPELYWSANNPKFQAIWINIDRVGSNELPTYLTETYLTDFKNYYNEGHGFYLSKAASKYVVNLGRMTQQVSFSDSASGGQGSDDWWIRLFTENASAKYLATGLYSAKLGTNEYLSYGLCGTANAETSLYREDHNTGWNTTAISGGRDAFQTAFNCNVLGTWDHSDGSVALIVEFPATDGVSGTIITNGVAAYQWQTQDELNMFVDNVERLTANAINYLAGNTDPAFKVAMFIDADRVKSIASGQEKLAAEWFKRAYVYQGFGEFITTASSAADITDPGYKCIWINVDRYDYTLHALPEYLTTNVEAFKAYHNNNGNLFLTKYATRFVVELGRITEAYTPGKDGAVWGNAGAGTITNANDIWGINPHIGQANVDAIPAQYYEHANHDIYSGLQMSEYNHNNGQTYEIFPMVGCADGGSIQRNPNNCGWDLNKYTYTAAGVNTVEKFQSDNACTVIGTWHDVVDYAVATVVEFDGNLEGRGCVIANGASAYQWIEGNAFQSNVEKLTANSISYLAGYYYDPSQGGGVSGIDEVETASDGPARFFNLQGIEVDGSNLTPGIYIRIQGNKTTKFLVK